MAKTFRLTLPNTPEQRASLLLYIAQTSILSGNSQQISSAREYLDEAVKSCPDDLDVRQNAIILYSALRELPQRKYGDMVFRN